MTMHQDQRVVELEELALEEKFRLPYPADYIVWLEDRGFIVELVGGAVYSGVTVATMPNAQAVSYLLSQVEGAIVI